MIKKVICISFVFLMFSLTSAHAGEKARIDSPFSVLEYNTVSKQYSPRLTFLVFEKKGKNKDVLWVGADFIRKSELVRNYGDFDVLRFKEKYRDQHIALIDKFLEWEEIASKDKDILNKEIGIVSKQNYTFFSGSSESHYLVIQFCPIGCTYSQFNFDREQAIALRNTLTYWRDNGIDIMSKDEVGKKYK